MFVGAVSDNFDERIEQKIFHAEIVVDLTKVSAEAKAYQPTPIIAEFLNADGSDRLLGVYIVIYDDLISFLRGKRSRSMSRSSSVTISAVPTSIRFGDSRLP